MLASQPIPCKVHKIAFFDSSDTDFDLNRALDDGMRFESGEEPLR